VEATPIAVNVLATLLERATGQQLLPGRHWRIETALGPLLRQHNLSSLTALAGAASMAPDGALAAEVVEALLNHETSFFRDPEPFRLLVGNGLDALRARRAGSRCLTLWSAGCATGQELYSLAMALAADPERWAGWQLRLTGTDISGGAIAKARDGRFTHFEVQRGLPITDLVRHFDADHEQWRIKPELRQITSFARHNLLDPPPARGFDVILCRNVLLYFAPRRQKAVLERLREAIAPDGLLMLGAGETVLGHGDLFRVDPELRGLYRPVV